MILLLALAAITASPEVSKDLEAKGALFYAAGRCNDNVYRKDEQYLFQITNTNTPPFDQGYIDSLHNHGLKDYKTKEKIDPRDCAATVHDFVVKWIASR